MHNWSLIRPLKNGDKINYTDDKGKLVNGYYDGIYRNGYYNFITEQGLKFVVESKWCGRGWHKPQETIKIKKGKRKYERHK